MALASGGGCAILFLFGDQLVMTVPTIPQGH